MSKLVSIERLTQLAQALDQRAKAAVEAEKTRAEAAEKRIEGKADANTAAIAAINHETTGILVESKKYTDAAIEKVNGSNAAVVGRVDKLEAAVGDSEKGLVKDVADIKTKDAEQDVKIKANTDALGVLKGGVEVEGSVAKAVKDAVDPVSGKVTALEGAVGVKGDGHDVAATGLYKEIADSNATTLAAANRHAEAKITELVNGAPEAMNTLKELADAIQQHQGVYDAYVAQVTKELEKKVDKVEGSRLITDVEAAQYAAKAEVSQVNKALKDAEAHTATEIGKVTPKVTALEEKVGAAAVDDTPATGLFKDIVDLKAKNQDQDGKITAAQAKADEVSGKVGVVEGKVTTLEGVVGDSGKGLVKDVADHGTAIAAINNGETGILAEAKKYADNADKVIDGKVTAANAEIAGLKATVGKAAVEQQPATGLFKDVADLKAKDTALEGRVSTNTAAIAKLNGGADVEGSVTKKINDALTAYSDTEEIKTLLGNVVNSLALAIEGDKIKLNLGGVDGITVTETTLDLATTEDIDAIIAGLDAPAAR